MKQRTAIDACKTRSRDRHTYLRLTRHISVHVSMDHICSYICIKSTDKNLPLAGQSFAVLRQLPRLVHSIHQSKCMCRIERLSPLLIRVALFAERCCVLHSPLSRLTSPRCPSLGHSGISWRGLCIGTVDVRGPAINQRKASPESRRLLV